MKKKTAEQVPSTGEVKRKPGRKPMTAEEKEAAAKVRDELKEKAANLKPEFLIQYQGSETNMAALVEAAKEDFHNTHKRTLVTALTLYIKPEESAAYYVINGSYEGKISY